MHGEYDVCCTVIDRNHFQSSVLRGTVAEGVGTAMLLRWLALILAFGPISGAKWKQERVLFCVPEIPP